MAQCWLEDPVKRPTFTQLLNRLDAMLESLSSAQYISFKLDESRDYYRLSTTGSDGDDDVFGSFRVCVL